jgi:hypothetical protein
MLKLHLLLLAKLQWDMRQCPDAVQVATPNTEEEARLRTALARAVPGMVSPCVAGDLLQQRAPGLLPHRRRCKRQLPTRNGRRREVVEESIIKQPSTLLSSFLNSVNCCRLACRHDGRTFDALGEPLTVVDADQQFKGRGMPQSMLWHCAVQHVV